MYNGSVIKSATRFDKKEINDVASYLRELLHLNSNNKRVLFRGQADESFPLVPSIGREKEGKPIYDLDDEHRIFLEFKKRYYSFTNCRPTSDADLLFLAQHHELPTRLLDWTYNPLIALYFACLSHEDMDGAIYTISIDDNSKSIKEGHELDDCILDSSKYKQDYYFIIPDDTHVRYVHQSGMFILFKNPTNPIANLNASFIIKNKKLILEELAYIGITDSFVLPTLDNLCKEIKRSIKNNNNL